MQPKIFCNRLGKTQTSEKEKLTDTAQNLFHLLTEFAKLKKKEFKK